MSALAGSADQQKQVYRVKQLMLRMQQPPCFHFRVFCFGLGPVSSKRLHVLGACEQCLGIAFSCSISDSTLWVLSYPFAVQDHQNTTANVFTEASALFLLPDKGVRTKTKPCSSVPALQCLGYFFNQKEAKIDGVFLSEEKCEYVVPKLYLLFKAL